MNHEVFILGQTIDQKARRDGRETRGNDQKARRDGREARGNEEREKRED